METNNKAFEKLIEPKYIKEEFDPLEIKEELVTDDDIFGSPDTIDAEFVNVGQMLNVEIDEIKTEEMFVKEERVEIPPNQLNFHLKRISFIRAACQYKRQYQVKVEPYRNQFRDNYILTSGPGQNNTRTEWKLFIPATCDDKIPVHTLENMNVEYDLESGHFDFGYLSSHLIVQNVEDLASFMLGILGGKHLLVTDQNMQRISEQFGTLGTQLIPTFTSKTEDGTCLMYQADVTKLGYEEVPNDPIKNEPLDITTTPTPPLANSIPAQLTRNAHKEQDNNVGGKFKKSCETCMKLFISVGAFLKHSKACSQTSICLKCNTKFKSVKYLKAHVKRIHSEGKFLCEVCQMRFMSSAKLKSHSHTHDESRVTCPDCGKTFKNKRVLKTHKYKKHSLTKKTVKVRKCPFCPKVYKGDRGLRFHKAKYHKTASEVTTAEEILPGAADKNVEVFVVPEDMIAYEVGGIVPHEEVIGI
eukprot:GFUD01025786.1.p1 GENE.GFUD01025786.1~~GFUD01025786.1.p1  ORF type:complete len:471 (+),score=97.22 GFUD01025786.1:286-1698(+)